MALAVGSPGAETPYSVSIPITRRALMGRAYEAAPTPPPAAPSRACPLAVGHDPGPPAARRVGHDGAMSPPTPAAVTGRAAPAVRTPLAVGADALAILVFVLLGRGSHAEGTPVGGTLAVAWPFLAGAGLGWAALLALRGTGRPVPAAVSLPAGGIVLAGTVLVGMALRRVAGGGTPLSFVLVATGFLALFLLGWRAGTTWWAVRRR